MRERSGRARRGAAGPGRWLAVGSVALVLGSCSARGGYLSEVGEYCASANSRVSTDLAFAAEDRFSGADSQKLPARVAVLDELLAKARAARPPAGEERILADWLTGVQKVRDEEQEVYETGRELGPSASFAVAMLLGVHDDAADSADRAAGAVGADECAHIGEWKAIRR